ncbi:GtrA family protein [Paenibacillus guangzhouensis]|uniref:GtrA family protein n=1 Tax=Paenibacillus guangzhouensis TaxID=1473112 RepID=UPI001266E9C0|nr:GtrA family protein [Paenibacillus guangzhouensis]
MDNQFVKFIIVGVINTIFGYSVFSLFIFVGLHYTLASLLSTLVGILFNFKTTGRIVFKSSDNSLIIKFFITYGVTYLLNLALLTFLKEFVSIYIAYAILILPMSMVSYILNKRFVFRVKATNN